MSITISQLKKKVDLAKNGINDATARIVKENEVKILDYVRLDQLGKGFDSEGKRITSNKGNYSGFYAHTYNTSDIGGSLDSSPRFLPKSKGSPYNFAWSGETRKGFFTKYSNFELQILNRSANMSNLISFYDAGEKLIEMSEENQVLLSSEITRPNLFKYLNKIFK